MAPYKLKNSTIKQLRELRDVMLQLEYLIALEQLTLDKRRNAALQLSKVQTAYLKLRAEQLADIRQDMVDNEADLLDGIKEIQKVINDLKEVEQIMQVTAAFLNIVGRIIALG